MIPSYFSTKNPSKAERKIFEKLELLDIPGFEVCFHSQNLKAHHRKRVAEIDFLLLGKAGLLVIEVKGGRVKLEEDGHWLFTDGAGNTTRKQEGPFEQAHGAMFSLEKMLTEELNFKRGSLTLGSCVVFTDQSVKAEPTAAWDDSELIDASKLMDPNIGLGRALEKAFGFWRGKVKHEPVSPENIKRIREFCRPQFHEIESLRTQSNSFEDRIIALSANLTSSLEMLETNPRLLVTGAAGTGKTLLAFEHVKQLVARGKSVLFTAKNKNIAELFKQEIDSGQFSAMSFGQMKLAEATLFDAVVVDEAQDITNLSDLSYLDTFLVGGIENGNWAIFLDNENQTSVSGEFDADEFEYLARHSTRLKLKENVRNTPAIIEFVRQQLGVQTPYSSSHFGLKPKIFSVKTQAELAQLASEELELLLDEGVLPEDIALLSNSEFRDSLFWLVKPEIHHKIADMSQTGFLSRPRSKILFSSVEDYKGLEAKHVLYDAPKDTDSIASKNYVAYTRSRHTLTVFRQR